MKLLSSNAVSTFLRSLDLLLNLPSFLSSLASTLDICQKHFPCQSKLLSHMNSHQKLKTIDSSPTRWSEENSDSPQEYEQHEENEQSQQNLNSNSPSILPTTASVSSVDHHTSPPQTRGQLVQFILEQELNNQSRSHEFAVPTRTMSSSYPCDICFEIFRKKTLLRTHKLALHGIAEFRCGQIFHQNISF
jgi:hypothetical protein